MRPLLRKVTQLKPSALAPSRVATAIYRCMRRCRQASVFFLYISVFRFGMPSSAMATSNRKAPIFALAAVFLLFSIVSAEIFFEEHFDDDWEKRWVKSDWKKDEDLAGNWNHTSGKWFGNPLDKGIQTTEDGKFYAISAKFPVFSNQDKTLVFQFSVKHEQKVDCAGGYMKLIGGEIDQTQFEGETPYSIMFGPDICGPKLRQVHVILSRNGKNHLIKKEIPCFSDRLTHVYTLILYPNATYKVLIDNEKKREGSLSRDWDIIPPKKIRDPNANKPEDWDEREYIDDPTDKKPEGYDDIPEEIPDFEATQPEDWDEDDGEWTAPKIPNPEYKGPWTPKQIKNPDYKGKWKAPMIQNPDFKDDPDIYIFSNLKYVGIELWQVKSGTLFDNVLICDDPGYARNFAEKTWGKNKEIEKERFEEEEQRRLEQESNIDTDDSDIEDDEDDEDVDKVDGGNGARVDSEKDEL